MKYKAKENTRSQFLCRAPPLHLLGASLMHFRSSNSVKSYLYALSERTATCVSVGPPGRVACSIPVRHGANQPGITSPPRCRSAGSLMEIIGASESELHSESTARTCLPAGLPSFSHSWLPHPDSLTASVSRVSRQGGTGMLLHVPIE